MLRFAIVEDDNACAEQLQEYLAQYAKKNSLEIRTDRFYDGLNFVEDYKARWDLIFMDIEMPLLDGMSAGRKIREKDDSVLLIFIDMFIDTFRTEFNHVYKFRFYLPSVDDIFLLSVVSDAVYSD